MSSLREEPLVGYQGKRVTLSAKSQWYFTAPLVRALGDRLQETFQDYLTGLEETEYDPTDPGDAYRFFVSLFLEGLETKTGQLREHVRCAEALVSGVQDQKFMVYAARFDAVADSGRYLLRSVPFEFRVPVVLIKNPAVARDALAALFERGLSGYYSNPIEWEECLRLQKKFLTDVSRLTELNVPDVYPRYSCDACGRPYRTAKGLLEHLKKFGHDDGVYSRYGYWKGEYARYLPGHEGEVNRLTGH